MDERDIAYACICGGDLVETGIENGRKAFNCSRCHSNKQWECVVCKKPRHFWADEHGYICVICAYEYNRGERKLLDSEIEKINAWRKKMSFPETMILK